MKVLAALCLLVLVGCSTPNAGDDFYNHTTLVDDQGNPVQKPTWED